MVLNVKGKYLTMFKLVITSPAAKVLSRLPKNIATLIYQKLEELAQNPYRPNNNVKKLKGRPGYRLRVGDWRIIYNLKNEELEIIVIKVAPRGGAYQ
jgi:mRNA interferase RelE/StbE